MDTPHKRPRPGGSLLRQHAPFVVFMAGFGIYCLFLQFELGAALQRLFLTRIFFQVAIAALVIAAMRNLLGVHTLGLFAPAIVAIAFLATGLILGMGLLSLTLAAVLMARASIIREKVQEAHRVAILVTIVSITIASVAVIGLEFNQHELFFAVLFPVLIIGWIGERFVEGVDRVGWEVPTKELGWTIGAIFVSFLVIIQDSLVNLIMFNPVAWFFLVLFNWFLGTRVRFRLSERFRFGGVRRYYLGDDPVQGDFAQDVLTMAVRNREFVGKYNPPDVMALLSKDAAKALLMPLGVPVATTYMILHERSDIEKFRSWLSEHEKFVLKPGSGYGGEGIMLVKGKTGETYDTSFGPRTGSQIVTHAFSIIEGQFHGGREDSAVVEELLVQSEAIRGIVPIGLADIRVISFLGYPVMAMIRIPTELSGGKANIHMGAVAAGVRISTGTIVHSVWTGLPSPDHPDTGARLLGHKIPSWDEVLEVASEAQSLVGIGFAGVDIALDQNKGPIVMEVNRRPGLEIQNANAAGLLRRLRTIEKLPRRELRVEERVRTVKDCDRENWGLLPAKSVVPTDQPFGSQTDFESGKSAVTT